MSESIRNKAAIGAKWSGISGAMITVLQFLTVLVLARYISPEEFGVMAMVLVVQGLGAVFSQIGLSAAIIQAKELTNRVKHTLFWLNVALGFAVFLVILAISSFLASLLSMPQLIWALPVTASSFLVSAFAIQYRSLVQKELLFRCWAAIEITSATFAAFVSVAMAWQGHGLWALVIGFVSGSILSSVCWFVLGIQNFGRPELFFDWAAVRQYIKFGAYRLGAMLANVASSRIDQFIVGYLLGAEALGFYSLTIRLVLQPVERINSLISRVAFPAFSKVQDNRELLGRWFIRLVRFLALVNAPILICLAITAPWFVPVVLGDTWLSIIPLVQILSFYALFRSLTSTGGSVLLAIGRADYTFYWNVCLLLIIPVVVMVSAIFGNLVMIAWGLVLTQFVVMLVYQGYLIGPSIGQSVFTITRAFYRPVAAAILAAGIAILLVDIAGITNNFLSLSMIILIGGTVYTGLVFVAFRVDATLMLSVLQRRG